MNTKTIEFEINDKVYKIEITPSIMRTPFEREEQVVFEMKFHEGEDLIVAFPPMNLEGDTIEVPTIQREFKKNFEG